MTRPAARQLTWHTCPTCHKRAYPNRRTARHAARQTGPHLHTYRCPAGHWHIGHIPHQVKTGHTPRQEYRP